MRICRLEHSTHGVHKLRLTESKTLICWISLSYIWRNVFSHSLPEKRTLSSILFLVLSDTLYFLCTLLVIKTKNALMWITVGEPYIHFLLSCVNLLTPVCAVATSMCTWTSTERKRSEHIYKVQGTLFVSKMMQQLTFLILLNNWKFSNSIDDD